jgi:hypothetical protein
MKYQHHECVLNTLSVKFAWWKELTGRTEAPYVSLEERLPSSEPHAQQQLQLGEGGTRCAHCWLRLRNCWCAPHLLPRRRHYNAAWQRIREAYDVDLEVVMFYHALELGRSPNTAHVFENLCGAVTRAVFYGDTKQEQTLLQDIVSAARRALPHRLERTCVLYPCPEAVSLDQWIGRCLDDASASTSGVDPSSSSSSSSSSTDHHLHQQPQQDGRPLLRLIVLDGTYSHARTMMKFFKACQEEWSLSSKNSLQFVQLDLDRHLGAQSAVAGIMYQPAKDKICSYQATVMAVRQVLHAIQCRSAGVDNADLLQESLGDRLCDDLLEDLQQWILHILKNKIKCGKSSSRASITNIDNKLSDDLKATVVGIDYCNIVLDCIMIVVWLMSNCRPF